MRKGTNSWMRNYKFSFFFRKYAETIPRDFGVRYNPYTQTVEILDSKPQIQKLIQDVQQDMQVLLHSMRKLWAIPFYLIFRFMRM